MNGFLIAIAFLLAAPGRIYALNHFQVPPPAKTEKPAKAVSLHPVIPNRTAVVSPSASKKDDNWNSRSRTVMPVLLEYLPYAQALQEGVPGITATPLPNNKNPTFVMVIPLTPEDLPIQSQNPKNDMKDDMRDALAPAHDSVYTFSRHALKHCELRQSGRCPFSQMEFTPEGIKRCKSRNRLSWWTRILPAPAFNILLQKLYFPRSKAPELKTGEPDRPAVLQSQIYQEEAVLQSQIYWERAVLRRKRRAAFHPEISESDLTRSASGGAGMRPAEGGADVPSLANEIFNQ